MKLEIQLGADIDYCWLDCDVNHLIGGAAFSGSINMRDMEESFGIASYN